MAGAGRENQLPLCEWERDDDERLTSSAVVEGCGEEVSESAKDCSLKDSLLSRVLLSWKRGESRQLANRPRQRTTDRTLSQKFIVCATRQLHHQSKDIKYTHPISTRS